MPLFPRTAANPHLARLRPKSGYIVAARTLTAADLRYHLVASEVSRAGLEQAVGTFEEAIHANDASALYRIVSGSIGRAYDEATFVTTWEQSSAEVGRVTALRRGRVGPIQTTDQGNAYVIVEYDADLSVATASAARFRAFVIREAAGWRLWTTVRP